MTASRTYAFGPYRLDASEHRLLRREEVIPLSPKVFETLLVLVEHGGHVLTKGELMQALWPDSFVEESSLTQNISLLRKALQEGGTGGRFIETVPKHGYRFVAPVEVLEVENDGARRATEKSEAARATPEGEVTKTPTEAEPTRARLSRRVRVGAFGASVLLLACALGAVYLRQPDVSARRGAADASSRRAVRSLAVLPLKQIGGDGRDEFIGLGMADALIIKLSAFERLDVLPTSTIIKYAGREYDAQTVGRGLGVDAVLDGTVQREGERVRVSVLLFDLREGRALWSNTFDERYTDIFALQDSISEKVAGVLRPQLAAAGTPLPARRFTADAEAHRLYAVGLFFWNKRTKEGLTKAIDYFTKATARDPDYALAHALLADCYSLSHYYGHNIVPDEEAERRATAAAERALALDDTLAEAHTAVGTVRAEFAGDFASAIEAYRRAIELNPNHAIVRTRYALALLNAFRLDEALPEGARAQELDPLSPTVSTTLSAFYIYAARYEEAIRASSRALEIDPQFGWARVNLAECYEWLGDYERAAAEYATLTRQDGFVLYGKLGLASVYARSGRQTEARRLLAALKSRLARGEGCPELTFQIALVHTTLGDNEEAARWLERAVASGDARLYQLRYSRQLDPLKRDPRYGQVLGRYERTRRALAQLLKPSQS